MVVAPRLLPGESINYVCSLSDIHCHYSCSAENNYLVMLGHMSKQTQLWSDTQILWSDIIFQ